MVDECSCQSGKNFKGLNLSWVHTRVSNWSVLNYAIPLVYAMLVILAFILINGSFHVVFVSDFNECMSFLPPLKYDSISYRVIFFKFIYSSVYYWMTWHSPIVPIKQIFVINKIKRKNLEKYSLKTKNKIKLLQK